MYDALPERIQALGVEVYKRFLANPDDPALARHALRDTRRGRHRIGSFSVSVTMRYRAIYVPDGATNVWYWIGTHEAYNNLVGP